jgi:hypothetical protein
MMPIAATCTAEAPNWKGKGEITELPSLEELKGHIRLKINNLMLGKSDSGHVSNHH